MFTSRARSSGKQQSEKYRGRRDKESSRTRKAIAGPRIKVSGSRKRFRNVPLSPFVVDSPPLFCFKKSRGVFVRKKGKVKDGRAELGRAVREQVRVGEVVDLCGRVSSLAARRKAERGRAKCFVFSKVDLPPRARVLRATLGWCPCSCSASKGKVCHSEHA